MIMSDGARQSDRLTSSLRAALSRPPAQAGERLLSERQLASRLNVTHARVRRAIRTLVDEGVLVQRRGDGTYIRCLPRSQAHAQLSDIRTEMLLHGGAAETPDPLAAARQLTIGLWWDAPTMMTPVQQSILSGMIERVEQRGHRLALHHLRRVEGKLASSADVVRVIGEQGSDGYLVPVWRAETFEAVRPAIARPILYFGTDMLAPYKAAPNPHVLFNLDAAWQEALDRLEDAGCRRVLIAHIDPSRAGAQAARIESRLHRRRHATRLVSFEPFTSDDAVAKAIAAALDGDAPPDGVLISDDHLLAPVAALLRRRGLVPGRDVALITAANRGHPLPDETDWTRFELDVETFGSVVADTMLRSIEDSTHRPVDLAVRLSWHEGETARFSR